jgi:hypothetical protein
VKTPDVFGGRVEMGTRFNDISDMIRLSKDSNGIGGRVDISYYFGGGGGREQVILGGSG